jgi:hypothetical protein
MECARGFPLALPSRVALDWSAIPGICRKSDYFYLVFHQSKAALEERDLLGGNLGDRASQTHLKNAVPKVAP